MYSFSLKNILVSFILLILIHSCPISESINDFVSRNQTQPNSFYNIDPETRVDNDNAYAELVDVWPPGNDFGYEIPLAFNSNEEGAGNSKSSGVERRTPFINQSSTQGNKDFDISMTGKTNISEKETLESLAQKLGQSAMEVTKTKKSVKTQKPQVSKKSKKITNANYHDIQKIVKAVLKDLDKSSQQESKQQPLGKQKWQQLKENGNVEEVLEHIFQNIQDLRIQQRTLTEAYEKADESQRGKPCDIRGSWRSHVLGIRLNISLENGYDTYVNLKQTKNFKVHFYNLHVALKKKLFGKSPKMLDSKWKLSGTAMDVIGGPFYLNTHSGNAKILGSFLGYCRTCGDWDTIFGSWSFLLPSKNCLDITTSIQNNRDIWRREKRSIITDDSKRIKNNKIPENCRDLEYLDYGQ